MIRHNDLTLSYLESTPSGLAEPGDPIIVLIHGRGADATDLAPLAPPLGGDRPYRFVLPDAPHRFTLGDIDLGYTWFDGYPPAPSSVRESLEKLGTFLDEIADRYDTASARTLLCGFSQGALMALACGLRRSKSLAGIVALSGGIDEPNLPDGCIRSTPPVLMIHGTGDDAVPVELARQTRTILQSRGIEPEYHELAIGHQIIDEEIEMIRRFVRALLDE